MTINPAEQISQLLALKEKGAITEEEFNAAKAKLLENFVNPVQAEKSASEKLSAAADTVVTSFSNSLSDNDVGFKNLAWILYWGTVGTGLLGLFPIFAWLSTFLGLGIIIIAALKMAPARGTIYSSHFKNLVVISIVGLVGYFLLLLITLGTLGFGIILTLPLGIALVIWYVYRVVKGMMKLNEGSAL